MVFKLLDQFLWRCFKKQKYKSKAPMFLVMITFGVCLYHYFFLQEQSNLFHWFDGIDSLFT